MSYSSGTGPMVAPVGGAAGAVAELGHPSGNVPCGRVHRERSHTCPTRGPSSEGSCEDPQPLPVRGGKMLGVSRDGDVVTIEMQREQRRNALNTELVTALREGVLAAVADGARAIVLTGRGPIFSAGADLNGVYSDEFLELLMDMLHTIESAPVPVISAINGAAIGGGVQLTLASDLRVMEPDAYIGIPAARIGVSVDRWTMHRLVSLIGGGPARSILLGAEQISARDCYTYGFANRLGTLA